MKLQNGGLKQSTTYNSRLQPNVLSAEDLSPAATLMSFTYDFDLDPSPTAVQNNGNVRREEKVSGTFYLSHDS
jgi:hypothetical protein